jgi:hypothetical protein
MMYHESEVFRSILVTPCICRIRSRLTQWHSASGFSMEGLCREPDTNYVRKIDTRYLLASFFYLEGDIAFVRRLMQQFFGTNFLFILKPT